MARLKDTNNPYKPRTFKPSTDENLNVINFINEQDNFNDTIRYLIEKEIYENGIRNLQEYIPRTRSNEYFDKILYSNIKENQLKVPKKYVVEDTELQDIKDKIRQQLEREIKNNNDEICTTKNNNELIKDKVRQDREKEKELRKKEDEKIESINMDIPDCYDI